jgi:hypothetical protein
MIRRKIAAADGGHKSALTDRHHMGQCWPRRDDFVLARLGVLHNFPPSPREPRSRSDEQLTVIVNGSGCGGIAQLVERLHGMQKVRSSNLLTSTRTTDPRLLPGVFRFRV